MNMAKNFYIIGHNPNTIEAVDKYLSKGANGIEPDICYHEDMPDKFYVHEDIEQIPDFIEHLFHGKFLSLKDYLKGLKLYLKDNTQYDLKIIAFDLKPDYGYDINDLYKIIREDFSKDFPDVKILTTVTTPKAMEFLANLKNQKPNEAFGVDERAEPEEVHEFFKNKNFNYSFGTGSSFFEPDKDKYRERIDRALNIRDNGGFKMVHSWCVNEEDDMRSYLDLAQGIDAMITDNPEVLKALIESPDYNQRFTPDFKSSTF